MTAAKVNVVTGQKKQICCWSPVREVSQNTESEKQKKCSRGELMTLAE